MVFWKKFIKGFGRPGGTLMEAVGSPIKPPIAGVVDVGCGVGMVVAGNPTSMNSAPNSPDSFLPTRSSTCLRSGLIGFENAGVFDAEVAVTMRSSFVPTKIVGRDRSDTISSNSGILRNDILLATSYMRITASIFARSVDHFVRSFETLVSDERSVVEVVVVETDDWDDGILDDRDGTRDRSSGISKSRIV